MDELHVSDLEFLHGCANPTLILIHQDVNGKHVKAHEISLRDKEFVKMFWRQDNVETEASMIIPVPSPLGGAIVIGQESILYHDGVTCVVVAPAVIKVILTLDFQRHYFNICFLQQSTITCYARVDAGGYRYLLGDMAGHLFMLFLETETPEGGQEVVKDLKVALLGLSLEFSKFWLMYCQFFHETRHVGLGFIYTRLCAIFLVHVSETN